MKRVTIQEAAEYLNVHADTLREWETRGYIKPQRTPGGHRRYDLKELETIANGGYTPKLSLSEREVLANQYLILENQYSILKSSVDAEWAAKRREVFEVGIEYEYDDERIDPQTISDKECREIRDILLMFEHLKWSYEHLGDDGIDMYAIQFRGFDGNEEAKQLTYVRWICEDYPPRFQSITPEDGFNAHSCMLSRYRDMLQKYNKIKRPWSVMGDNYLSKEEIISLSK